MLCSVFVEALSHRGSGCESRSGQGCLQMWKFNVSSERLTYIYAILSNDDDDDDYPGVQRMALKPLV